MHLKYLSLCSSLLAATWALPSASSGQISALEKRVSFPFTRMVAFGDNLSDNGNGSYANCVANPKNCSDTIYGYKTWTNGPVAVSYLSTDLGIPLTDDYAFGEGDEGTTLGATINNSYTSSKYAPDGFTQVADYLAADGTTKKIANTLHFVWIGNNDVSDKHIYPADASNPAFAKAMAKQMEALVQNLVDAGAESIIVPAIYPKHLAPFRQYLATKQKQWTNIGKAISQANTAIEKALKKKFPKKVLFYDAFTFMSNIYENPTEYGIKYILPDFCDGYSEKDFKLCITQGKGDLFYWTNYSDMTTLIHSLLATDMAAAIRTKWAEN